MVALALAAGCRSVGNVSAPQDTVVRMAPERGQVWQLVAVRGREVSRNGRVTTLLFNLEAGNVSGQAYCNTYYADCRMAWQGGDGRCDRYSMELTGVVAGQVQCPEAVMNADSRYLALLAKVDEAMLTGGTLTLLTRGREVLKYELQ